LSLNLEVAVAEVDEPSFTIHLKRDPEFNAIDLVVSTDNHEYVLGFIDDDGVLQLEEMTDEDIDDLALSGLSFTAGYLDVVA
jgi:hypothetical protein